MTASTEIHHPNTARRDVCTIPPTTGWTHDDGLDLEAIQANTGHDLGAWDHGHQLHHSKTIGDVGVATYSRTMPPDDQEAMTKATT
jgi:hypothetical protein